MGDPDILNSTERLLHTIREDNHKVPPDQVIPDPVIPNPVIPNRPPRQVTSIKTNIKHSLVAGVFIGDDSLSLVLTGERKPGTGREIIKWSHTRIPRDMDRESQVFISLLRTSISRFLDTHKKVSLWTGLDSRYLKLRKIVIPYLPPGKIANAAFWGLKKEIELDGTKEVFDFEVGEEILVGGVKKREVIAFSGDKQQIDFLTQSFSKAGYPLTGITAMPFAMQNFVRADLVPGASPVVMVHIARYYSDITCFSNEGVLLARNIRTGSYSLVEELIESNDSALEGGDIPGFLSSLKEKDSPGFERIEHSANRLTGKILRTGDYCSHNYASNTPVSKFYFFGETDDCQAFMDYAADQFPCEMEKFNPFGELSSSLGMEMPKLAEERNSVISALGLALSQKVATPNFLHTYIQKNIETKYRKMNIAVAAVGMVALLVCGGVWGWLCSVEAGKIKETRALEKQIAHYNPIVTQTFLTRRIQEAKEKSQMIKRYTSDFLSLAVINEICSLTPEKINILSLDSNFIKEEPEAGNKKKKKEKKRSLTLQGIVSAEFTDLESTLTGYVITLGDSPIFGDILLQNKKIEKRSGASILKFTADMEIL